VGTGTLRGRRRWEGVRVAVVMVMTVGGMGVRVVVAVKRWGGADGNDEDEEDFDAMLLALTEKKD
jgi:hypothetical protein